MIPERTSAVTPWEIVALVKEKIEVEEGYRNLDAALLGDEHPSIIRRDGRIEGLRWVEREAEKVLR